MSIQDAVEADYETELSRLGSSKAIYALTGGEMDAESVLTALGDRAATAAASFEPWADDPDLGDLFADAAETVRTQAEAIAEEAGEGEPSDDPGPVESVLRELEGSDARLGGLLGWALVTDRTLAQAVGFFVGDADPAAADRFRDRRTAVDELRAAASERLEDVDETRARATAGAVVEAAYDEYVETLEGLGVTVKPVC